MAAPLLPDEQAAFLAAIVADPDDDTPRLVYADWLQENGDEEQARFVRESISIEWLEDHEDERRQQIAKRIDDTALARGTGWLDAVGIVNGDPVYGRGMVEGIVYAGLEAFLAEAPTLFARVPVRELTIANLSLSDPAPDRLDDLADLPDLARLRTLRLANGGWPVPSGWWERFVVSPHLANLRELSVQSSGLTDDDVQWIDKSASLTNLEELGLSGNNLTAAGALAVVRSPRLPRLTRLGLAYNNIAEDRRRGSAYRALIDALHKRFDGTQALGQSL